MAASGHVVPDSPSSSSRAMPGARPSGYAWTSSSAPLEQRLVGDRVHVADDDVGLEPGLEDGVGAAVHADEHGLHLADVRLQRVEVFLVVVAAHDDHDVAVVQVRLHVRDADTLGQQRLLLVEELERVARELGRADRPCRPWRPPSRARPTSTVSRVPEATTTPSSSTSPPLTSIVWPSLTRSNTSSPTRVDERHAAAGEQQRTDVGVGAGDRPGGVDDDLDAGGRAALRRSPGPCRRGR